MDRNEVILFEKEFCPPIDTALFSAILSDYDLTKADSVADLRATLELLKETAECNTSFDPSGTSGAQDDSSIQNSSKRAQSWNGDPLSEETSLTNLSRSSKSVGINSDVGNEVYNAHEYTEIHGEDELEELPSEDKLKMLMEMFPTMKEFDIKYILRKVDNVFGNAIEQLLNHVFLEEEENYSGEKIITKGIDGFTESNPLRGRKAKAKRKRQSRRTSSIPNALVDEPENMSTIPRSRWDRAKEEIQFITQRTYLSHETVSSVYHKSGASLTSTIANLCVSADSNPDLSATSYTVLQAHISELAFDFPTIPLSKTTGLIYLAHPSTASAHELARILASSTSAPKITPHYLPRPPSPPSSKEPAQTLPRPPSLSTPAHLVSTRQLAIAQASSAYRKSKSKPLMAGAASYYSSVAREASNSLRLHEAAAAEALVTSQSKSGEIDLHGANVQDAVRIAKDRVEAWWENGASEWARAGKARGTGLKIVTGLGRHSEGKRGRLGPAVGGMLLREGWKVEIGEGIVVVVGRTRK